MWAFISKIRNRGNVDGDVLTDAFIDICVSLGLSMGGGGTKIYGSYYIVDMNNRTEAEFSSIIEEYKRQVKMVDGVIKVKCSKQEKA